MSQQVAEQAGWQSQQQKQQQQRQQEPEQKRTCTAPNRDACTVTCATGNCYAIYHEPNGPCKAGCIGVADKALELSREFSAQISVIQASMLAPLLASQISPELRSLLQGSDQPLTVTGTFTLESFQQELERLLTRGGLAR